MQRTQRRAIFIAKRFARWKSWLDYEYKWLRAYIYCKEISPTNYTNVTKKSKSVYLLLRDFNAIQSRFTETTEKSWRSRRSWWLQTKWRQTITKNLTVRRGGSSTPRERREEYVFIDKNFAHWKNWLDYDYKWLRAFDY